MTSSRPRQAAQGVEHEVFDPAIPGKEPESITISSCALTCHANLERLSRLLPTSPYRGLENVALDELGRLKIWASNLGAFQDSHSSSSLDARLRNAERMRSSVVSGIKRLNHAILGAQGIVSGGFPNRSDMPDPLPESLVRRTVERVLENPKERPTPDPTQQTSTTELAELFLNIQSSISNLFELSVLIRRDRPRGRTQKAGTQMLQTDPGPDIMHSKDKFPKLRQSPWLAEKVGAGISRQRDYIRYRQAHRKKLAAQPSAAAPERDARSVLLSEHATTKATSFGEPPVAPPTDTEEIVGHVIEERSIMTIATSFATTAPGGLSAGRKIPELTDLWLDGVQLQYGSHFECPYCRTIQMVSNRKQWKHHVYRDLELYVCTFQECTAAPFGTSHEWFQHEMDHHRRQWKCVMCQTKCDSASSLQAHFASRHGAAISAAQRPVMVKACETAVTTFDETSCPFCNDWRPPESEDNHSSKLRSHLEKHLQELAREALPLAIDGLEIRDDNDDDVCCQACGLVRVWSRSERALVCSNPVCNNKIPKITLDVSRINEESTSEEDEDDEMNKPALQPHSPQLQQSEGYIAMRVGVWNNIAAAWICVGPSLPPRSSFCRQRFIRESALMDHYRVEHADGLLGENFVTVVSCRSCGSHFSLPASCPSCGRQETKTAWIRGMVSRAVLSKFRLSFSQMMDMLGSEVARVWWEVAGESREQSSIPGLEPVGSSERGDASRPKAPSSEAHNTIVEHGDARQLAEMSQRQEDAGSESSGDSGIDWSALLEKSRSAVKKAENKNWPAQDVSPPAQPRLRLSMEDLREHDRMSKPGRRYDHDIMDRFLNDRGVPSGVAGPSRPTPIPRLSSQEADDLLSYVEVDHDAVAAAGEWADVPVTYPPQPDLEEEAAKSPVPAGSSVWVDNPEHGDGIQYMLRGGKWIVIEDGQTTAPAEAAAVEDAKEEVEEVAFRGDPDQTMIMEENYEFNPERRFVTVPPTEDTDSRHKGGT